MEQDLLCGIYKITSPTGRIYIGQSKNFEKRFSDYRRGRCPQQRRLFNSLFKHGFVNHSIEIIEICEVEDLDCRERYWQDFYNVKDRELGLNCVLVACGDMEEEKLKVRESRFLNKPKKEKVVKPKQTELQREFNRFRMSVTRNKSLTQKEKENLLINFKEGDLELRINKPKSLNHETNKKRFRPVLDTETGVFYTSLKELCILYGYNYGTMKQRLGGYLKNKTPFIYT